MSDLFALAWTFLRLSFLAVGGGIGVVPEMQRQVVEIQGWLTARQFVDGYALSQITPGPGMLVTAFIGYRVHGLLGASVAMAAMFLPTSLLTWIVAHRWERIQAAPGPRPWSAPWRRSLLASWPPACTPSVVPRSPTSPPSSWAWPPPSSYPGAGSPRRSSSSPPES